MTMTNFMDWDLAVPTQVRPLSVILREAQNELALSHRNRNNQSVQYLRRLSETIAFVEGVYEGRISTQRFIEAMSTSDFPLLFGDILDRQLLGAYEETPATWPQYLKRSVVRDFRLSRLIALDGLEQPFYPSFNKPEYHNVKEDNILTETGYTTSVEVYEKGFVLNWRMLINDDLDAFRDLPNRLARGARRTEQRLASGLYNQSTGPHSTFFSNANKNLINIANGALSNNPPLSVQGIKDGLNVLYRAVDTNGDPIFVNGATLVVPPTLQITAEEIIKATSFAFSPGTTTGVSFATGNWMGSRLSVAVDWYAPLLNTTSGHTAWYIFANPQARPAGTVTFLRGYETPGLYRKTPNTERVGGGSVPELGDFEDMSQRFKGLHIIGGTLIDPKSAVASDGTGA